MEVTATAERVTWTGSRRAFEGSVTESGDQALFRMATLLTAATPNPNPYRR